MTAGQRERRQEKRKASKMLRKRCSLKDHREVLGDLGNNRQESPIESKGSEKNPFSPSQPNRSSSIQENPSTIDEKGYPERKRERKGGRRGDLDTKNDPEEKERQGRKGRRGGWAIR